MVSLKTIVIALAGTASASSLVTRQASKVLSDLQSIQSQTAALTTSLTGFSGSLADAAPILAASSALTNTINGAVTDVNNAGTVSDADQQSILSAIEGLIPGIYDSLNAYESKAGAFASGGLSMSAAQTLTGIQQATDKLSAALISKASSSLQGTASMLAAEIDAAFSAALNTAPLPATTPVAGGSAPAATSTPAAGGSAPAATSTPAAGTTPAAGATSSTAAPAPLFTGGAAAHGVHFGAAVVAVAAMVL